MAEIKTLIGDCLSILDTLPEGRFDLIYLDPPFFTQKAHSLTTRDGNTTFAFRDLWASHEEYARFLHERLLKLQHVLAPTGSLFFYCDSSAVHIARLVLDQVFGAARFQSEIIWTYKRWSNTAKGLLPAHQTILFYSKSADFKFHTVLTDYSPSTNIDQTGTGLPYCPAQSRNGCDPQAGHRRQARIRARTTPWRKAARGSDSTVQHLQNQRRGASGAYCHRRQ